MQPPVTGKTQILRTQAAMATEGDPRWAAVLARDRDADGRFFYSVKTTGVYCRPSCAARRARPENVRFHATCAEAERAGFRACRRCRPGQRRPAQRARAVSAAGRAADLPLAASHMRYREDRADGADGVIRFAVGRCSLGSVLAAFSERGICSILIGDDARALARELHGRFPGAIPVGDGAEAEAEFADRLAEVLRFVEAPALGVELPLDARGTVFQRRVWEALRGIPAGATASYGEVARRIGMPAAARAVARACASNPIAVAIPCHRVVRNDGGLSGYRWGVARKRALLEREAGA